MAPHITAAHPATPPPLDPKLHGPGSLFLKVVLSMHLINPRDKLEPLGSTVQLFTTVPTRTQCHSFRADCTFKLLMYLDSQKGCNRPQRGLDSSPASQSYWQSTPCRIPILRWDRTAENHLPSHRPPRSVPGCLESQAGASEYPHLENLNQQINKKLPHGAGTMPQ